MSHVLIIGGGPAGMIAAITAARNGHKVEIIEKNEKLGKKLFITGKGRCNVTNAGDMDTLFSSVLTNPKFLYSAFYGFTNQQTMDFFEELGLHLKVERGNRVFPASDHSSDVIKALEREIRRLGITVHLNTQVTAVVSRTTQEDESSFSMIRIRKAGDPKDKIRELSADACIVATGGMSYKSTGSTGDGYRFAEDNGLKVTELSPALVPMEIKEWYAGELQGLSLRNVTATIFDGKKKLYEEFGEMLFTHYGVSGPIILSASSVIASKLKKHELTLSIDLKPALTKDQLDHRLLRDFEENKNKLFKNALGQLLPSKLIPVIVDLSGIDPEKQVNEVTRQERQVLVDLVKGFHMTIIRLRGFDEAIITKGGVSVKCIDPTSMEVKDIHNLYFAGEVLDLDALTGGFNLQIAWSTGYAAGNAIL